MSKISIRFFNDRGVEVLDNEIKDYSKNIH